MYRYSNGQISLADFKQPVGMNLKESNRWVKKAQMIPWPEIEKHYAALFKPERQSLTIFTWWDTVLFALCPTGRQRRIARYPAQTFLIAFSVGIRSIEDAPTKPFALV